MAADVAHVNVVQTGKVSVLTVCTEGNCQFISQTIRFGLKRLILFVNS